MQRVIRTPGEPVRETPPPAAATPTPKASTKSGRLTPEQYAQMSPDEVEAQLSTLEPRHQGYALSSGGHVCGADWPEYTPRNRKPD